MKNKLILLTFLSLMSFVQLSAQKKTEKLRIYSEDENDKSRKSAPEYKNLIKISPLLIIGGELPIILEHNLGKGFAAELGLGVTFRDFAGLLGEFNIDGDNDRSLRMRDSGNYKIGFTSRLGIRYYLDGGDDFPEGSYLQIEARYKRFNFNFMDNSNQFVGPQSLSLYDNIFDFVGVLGRQYEIGNNIYMDSYTGIGIRTRTSTIPERTLSPTGNGFIYRSSEISRTLPIYSLGFKIGYNF